MKDDPDKFVSLGLTSIGGALILPEFSAGARTIRVGSPGYCPTTIELPEQFAQFKVALSPSVPVTGRVVDASGISLGADVRVLALLDSVTSTGQIEARRALAGDRTQLLAFSDDEGEFRLEGIRAGSRYQIVAAGNGAATRDYVSLVAALDHPPISLVLEPLFAARIEFLDDSGNKVPMRGSKGLGPRLTAGTNDPDGQAFLLLDPCLELLDLAVLQAEPNARVFFFTAAAQRAQVGPNHLAVDVPGYVPSRAEFYASSILTDIVTTTVVLRQDSNGFATLAASFVRDSSKLPAVTVPAGTIFLKRAGMRTIMLNVPVGRESIREFERIPSGSYEAYFQIEAGRLRVPAEGVFRLELENGAVGKLDILVPELGGIRIDIVKPNSERYEGGITVNLSRGEPEVLLTEQRIHGVTFEAGAIRSGPTTSHYFVGPPYHLPGLAPGVYAVATSRPLGIGRPALTWPAGIPLRADMPAIVTVEAGSDADCRFVLIK